MARFWKAVRLGPHFQQHPIRGREGHERWGIPLKLHGDGTPVVALGKTWSKMMDIWPPCNIASLKYIFILHLILRDI